MWEQKWLHRFLMIYTHCLYQCFKNRYANAKWISNGLLVSIEIYLPLIHIHMQWCENRWSHLRHICLYTKWNNIQLRSLIVFSLPNATFLYASVGQMLNFGFLTPNSSKKFIKTLTNTSESKDSRLFLKQYYKITALRLHMSVLPLSQRLLDPRWNI